MRKFLNIGLILLMVSLLFAFYWNYFNVYSEGERVGKLFKVSLKGNVFKTYEAEMLMPGSKIGTQGFQNNFFYFSIPSDSLAKVLMNSQGKQVSIHYVQFRNSLPWRGDNYNEKNTDKGQYIADKLIAVKDTDF